MATVADISPVQQRPRIQIGGMEGLQRQPAVGVVVAGVVDVVRHPRLHIANFCLISRSQHVHRQQMLGARGIFHLAHQIVEEVSRLVVDHRHDPDLVQHPPASGEQIAALPLGERSLGVDPRVHHAQADGTATPTIVRTLCLHVEDAALPIPVLGRKASREQLDPLDCLDIHNAEQTVHEIPLVEWLVQLHPVQGHQHLVRFSAANGEL